MHFEGGVDKTYDTAQNPGESLFPLNDFCPKCFWSVDGRRWHPASNWVGALVDPGNGPSLGLAAVSELGVAANSVLVCQQGTVSASSSDARVPFSSAVVAVKPSDTAVPEASRS